ncbi:major capsid family protein [Kosakonia sacchari]|uniref:major capsid family protein n=1 Tax=Kosakonia sacchari TaxID=1158459 RepID=UPI0020C7C8C6|nr:major capsid family protein [Kosakonia sacchari]
MRGMNLDEQGLIFARDLISTSNTLYKVEMPQPIAISLFAQEPGVTEASQFVSYRMYTAEGMAKIMANFGTDMPMLGVKGAEFFAKMYPLGLGYGYTYFEMLAAAQSGTPLNNIQGMETREAHERTVSNIIWLGNAEYQIIGFLDHPNIPQVAVTGGWASATDDVILDDVGSIISAVNSSVIYRCSEFHMPTKAWTRIEGMRLSGTDRTVLSYLQNAYRNVTFRENSDLDGRGVCMAMMNNIRNFSQATPSLFRQHSPQQKGLDISIPCTSKTAGVIVRAPLAAAISSQVIQ